MKQILTGDPAAPSRASSLCSPEPASGLGHPVTPAIAKGDCLMCRIRGKTWRGDDPNCAFKHGGTFSPENWNCATVNGIRDICDDPNNLLPGADYQYCNDQKYASINISAIEDIEDHPLCLWVTWYKSRCGTDDILLLGDQMAPRRPTEGECRIIIDYFMRWFPQAPEGWSNLTPAIAGDGA